MYERFLIGQMSSGLQRNVKPYLIADDAFETLKNAYVFRGRVRKRFGARLLKPVTKSPIGYESLDSRLRINVGTTNAGGDLVAVVPGARWPVGASFSVTDGTSIEIFTITALGAPAVMLASGASTVHTINTGTGALVINGSVANAAVYFYPSEPVMGFATFEQSSVNDELTFAFDRQFAYEYTSTAWTRLGTAVWTGSDSQFFWAEMHRGATSDINILFVSNFVPADGIKYWTGAAWGTLVPAFNSGGDTIKSARIIISFKNRLVLLNTIETAGNVNHQNRCRFSQNGSPLAADAWREDIPGKGGFIDLPTQETIITAQHLRDRVIVFCERSTWELVYTGNQILPFVWQQINTELGAESTFSQVPFDQAVLGVGNVGIHACTGSSVERIDDLIPDEVFQIHNLDNGVDRVAGIRDYYSQHVFWTFPSLDRSPNNPFPDQVLAFNYATKSWAFFDDSITAFGYMQEGNTLTTWADISEIWSELSITWGGEQNNPATRSTIAGNQQGYTFIVDIDKTTNSESLQITNITAGPNFTIINHNLKANDFVLVQNCIGSTEFNDQIVEVVAVVDKDTITVSPITFSAYRGGGTVTRISRIDILTKQYNFYADQAKNMYIAKVDCLVDKTTFGQVTYDYGISSSSYLLADDAVTTGASYGTPILETSPYIEVPFEAQQDRVWHPIYLQAEGECVQLRFYLSDTQMINKDIVEADFQLNALCFYVQPVSRLQ